jgi:hypothetical protein
MNSHTLQGWMAGPQPIGESDLDVTQIVYDMNKAAFDGDLETVNELLGPDYDEIPYKTPADTIYEGESHVKLVGKVHEWPPKKGTKVKSKPKYMALHWAAEGGHVDIVRLLLNDAKGRFGVNDIFYSNYDYNNLQYKVNRTAVVPCGTALHIAVRRGHIDVVRELLNHPDIKNYIDAAGNTALFYATKLIIIQMLWNTFGLKAEKLPDYDPPKPIRNNEPSIKSPSRSKLWSYIRSTMTRKNKNVIPNRSGRLGTGEEFEITGEGDDFQEGGAAKRRRRRTKKRRRRKRSIPKTI